RAASPCTPASVPRSATAATSSSPARTARSASPSVAAGVPHTAITASPQNFCPGALAVPHERQTSASEAPHSPQNFWPEGLSAEHCGQIILARRLPPARMAEKARKPHVPPIPGREGAEGGRLVICRAVVMPQAVVDDGEP